VDGGQFTPKCYLLTQLRRLISSPRRRGARDAPGAQTRPSLFTERTLLKRALAIMNNLPSLGQEYAVALLIIERML
jgi:hypothetical protein